MTKTGEMCFRFVLVLVFMCLADSDARVFKSFKDCSAFFFQGQWPIHFKRISTNHKYICQQYNFNTYFATLYNTELRIPIFSAYRLDQFSCTSRSSRRSKWFIEPQLYPNYNNTTSSNMGSESQWQSSLGYQATNVAYLKSRYDRGHLNPTSYQCDSARTATFTLTNAVPQNPCFNRYKWRVMEQTAKKIMQKKCQGPGDKRFFVTGVIPNHRDFPSDEHDDEDDQKTISETINVPKVMWTAACCYHSNTKKGFSFSYLGRNRPESNIKALLIPDLKIKLQSLGYRNDISIFSNSCFASSNDSYTALDMLVQVINKWN